MISSKQNDLIKQIKALQSKKKYRLENGLFLIEGEKFVIDIIKRHPDSIAHLIVNESYYVNKDVLTRIATNCEPVVVTDAVYQYISSTKTPQGIMAVVKQTEHPIERNIEYDKILLLDHVQDSENVGTLIRSAVCAGYDAVFLYQSADAYSDKSVRASAGTVLDIIVSAINYEDILIYKNLNYSIVGSSLDGQEQIPVDLKKLILVIGNEGKGITGEVLDLCNVKIRIPIYGPCDSLNAAAAGAILMYKTIGY